MASRNVELARAGLALAEAYRTDDVAPLRALFEQSVDAAFVLRGEGEVFTEGEWRGPANRDRPGAFPDARLRGVRREAGHPRIFRAREDAFAVVRAGD